MATGILIVSHSEKLAEGIVELISEMANDSVVIKQAGGTEDGRLGTDAVRVQAVIESMADCGAILIYCDLGSSIISSEMAIEMLDDALREKVQIVDCPIVEGAFTGVVQASLTEDAAEIVAVSEQARELRKQS